jgi:hypothetical protein
MYDNFILLSNEQKQLFDPLKIFENAEFEIFLKNKINLLKKDENNNFIFKNLVDIFQKNIFGICSNNDAVESSFSFIQNEGEKNMKLKSLGRIIKYKVNNILVDECNEDHQILFYQEYLKNNGRKNINLQSQKNNSIIETLTKIKRAAPQIIINIEKKEKNEKVFEIIKNNNLNYFNQTKKLKKQNYIYFIENFKKIKLKPKITINQLKDIILNLDDENLINSFTFVKKKRK